MGAADALARRQAAADPVLVAELERRDEAQVAVAETGGPGQT
jgi:hypothetical protein